jgi:hypothetical protein
MDRANIGCIILLTFLITGLHGSAKQPRNCGSDPNKQRILREGGLRAPGSVNKPIIHIQASDIYERKGRIYVHKSLSGISSTYVSDNHGRTWERIDIPECTQIRAGLTVEAWTPCIMSRASIDVCYRSQPYIEGTALELTIDRGKNWRVVHPMYEDGQVSGNFEITGTSPTDQGRLYARMWSKGAVIGNLVSDNYGITFRKIREFPYECRNKYLFRVAPYPKPALSISEAKSISWMQLPAASVLFAPLYENMKHIGIYTTKQDAIDDKETIVGLENAVQQIECDPEWDEVFYILNRMKGVYRTINGGKTFTVLPIGDTKYLDIGEIATDATDTGVIYATVGRERLYRSENYGCSWDLLKVP